MRVITKHGGKHRKKNIHLPVEIRKRATTLRYSSAYNGVVHGQRPRFVIDVIQFHGESEVLAQLRCATVRDQDINTQSGRGLEVQLAISVAVLQAVCIRESNLHSRQQIAKT